MRKIEDLEGKRFGKLVVVKFIGYKQTKSSGNRSIWECKCDCGNIKNVLRDNLVSGRTKSCGCLKKENLNNWNNNTKRKYKRKRLQNTYDLTGEYGIGYTRNGKEFYFDLEDYDKIKDYYWCINDGYVASVVDDKYVWMHRLVLCIENDENKKVDHIKHNKCDNRKSKLRVVDVSKNNMNRKIRSDNTSGIVGVCWNKKYNKWMSYICAYGKRKTLGYFEDINEAIKARKEAEDEYFGEYSYDNSMNFPRQRK